MINEINIKKIHRKILIIKPSSLGDVIHSLPFLNLIKADFNFAKIHWIIAAGLESLLENHPMIDKLWIINKDNWKDIRKLKDSILEIKRLCSELKNESYDLVIDLQGLFRSGFFAKASDAPIRIGFAEARERSSMFYTNKVEGGKEIHAVDRYLKIASALGVSIDDVKFPMPLIVEPEWIKEIRAKFEEYAVIIPGARWETKKWDTQRFAELAVNLNGRFLVLGSGQDKEISDYIERHSKGKALSLAGKTNLKELIILIRKAKFVISNDSGPMHIAAACGIPVIAIFGPTNPARTGPYGYNHMIVKSALPCAPCYKRSCKSVKCLKDITVEMVCDAVTLIEKNY
jgi:heptosyltransferase-1